MNFAHPLQFQHTTLPNTVEFGAGKHRQLADWLQDYDKVMVIGSPRVQPVVKPLRAALGPDRLVIFEEVVQHVPDTLVARALAVCRAAGAQALLAIGGGSAIGLAKGIALDNHLPIIAVPTTYSGSEMTNIWGISSGGNKTTGRDPAVLPALVVFDPELTAGLPFRLAANSAMNAMAHLVEAVYAQPNNPITYHYSLLGIARLRAGMQALAGQRELSPAANEQLLFGAYLGGKALGEVSMALHHKTAHVLGGSFGLEHSEAHTVMLPYALAYQWPALPDYQQQDFRAALEHEQPPRALQDLARGLGCPTSLREIGFAEAHIPQAVQIMLQNPYPNPAPLEAGRLRQMLQAACEGEVSPLL
jgi:alcohol dehydrogenase class IV